MGFMVIECNWAEARKVMYMWIFGITLAEQKSHGDLQGISGQYHWSVWCIVNCSKGASLHVRDVVGVQGGQSLEWIFRLCQQWRGTPVLQKGLCKALIYSGRVYDVADNGDFSCTQQKLLTREGPTTILHPLNNVVEILKCSQTKRQMPLFSRMVSKVPLEA